MPLYKPIFIVGHGRCGSTVFHDVLCHHPDVAWFTQFLQKYPHRPYLNAWVNRCFDLPVLSTLAEFLAARRKIYPVEPYRFWEQHCHGFARPHRDLKAKDVIPRVIPPLERAIAKAIPSGKRLLAKITGWPRMDYLKAIFPDAKFVHIIRDGRAVVSSVLAAPYFDGWSGPYQWARGELSEEQFTQWNASGQSFVVLAAIGWENRMNAFEEAKRDLTDENYFEFKYEDFCENKDTTLKQVVEFLELPAGSTGKFLERTRHIRLKATNDKWKSDLSRQQQADLEAYLKPLLERYGYN